MTTTTPFVEAGALSGPPHRRAFTLVETLVAAALSLLIVAAILDALLMITRTGYRASSYSAVEAEIRRGLDTFAEDARQASDIHWVNSQCLTLTVPSNADTTQLVTYAYDTDPASSTYHCFYRQVGAPDPTAPREVLVHGVAPSFAFFRYKVEQPGVADNTASNDLETKQIQIQIQAVRTGVTTVAVSQTALSARFLLRNKTVSD